MFAKAINFFWLRFVWTGLFLSVSALACQLEADPACSYSEEQVKVRYAPRGPVRMVGTVQDRPMDVRQGDEVLRTTEKLFVSLEPTSKPDQLSLNLRVSVDISDLRRLMNHYLASIITVPTSSCTARYSLKGPYLNPPTGGFFTITMTSRHERWRCVGSLKDEEYWVEVDTSIKVSPTIVPGAGGTPSHIRIDAVTTNSPRRFGGFLSEIPVLNSLALIYVTFAPNSLNSSLKTKLQTAMTTFNTDLRRLTALPATDGYTSPVISSSKLTDARFAGNQPLLLDAIYKQERQVLTACQMKKDLLLRGITLDIVRR